MIENYLKRNSYFDCNIELSDESNQLLETGGGLKKAARFFSDSSPFLIHNVDVITDLNLNKFIDHHKKANALANLAVMERKSSRYFVFDKENILVGWKNEKTEESKVVRKPIGKIKLLAFSGIQIVEPKIFKFFPNKDVFYDQVESDVMGVVYQEKALNKYRERKTPSLIRSALDSFLHCDNLYELGGFNLVSPDLSLDYGKVSKLHKTFRKDVITDKYGYKYYQFFLSGTNSYFTFLHTPNIQNIEKTKYLKKCFVMFFFNIW